MKYLMNHPLEYREGDGKINIQMDHIKVSCEAGRWMQLAQDRVQWRVLVLAVLDL
jgi:hypothetical protein